MSVACILYFYRKELDPLLKLIYASKSYSDLGLSLTQGLLYRSLWFCIAVLMTASLICVFPNRRFPFTYIGERTLAVYIVHRLLRDALKYLHFYQYLDKDGFLLLLCIVISAIVVLISSVKPIDTLVKKLYYTDFVFRKDFR